MYKALENNGINWINYQPQLGFHAGFLNHQYNRLVGLLRRAGGQKKTLIFPKVPQYSLGILTVPQLPPPLGPPP